MSRLLELALHDCGDVQRLEDLAANDAADAGEPRVLRAFAVQIKSGKSVRAQFEAMGVDSCTVTMQHADLLAAGEYIVVRSVNHKPPCAECVVCGGRSEPGDDRLCDSCRNLAAVFSTAEARRPA